MTREVAIKAIQDFIGWFKEDSLIRKALDMAIQALSQEPIKYWIDHNGHVIPIQQPSITQKSGKWILLDECANSGYYCSNCQKKLVKEGWSQTVKKINYCPNCGAKMESEE